MHANRPPSLSASIFVGAFAMLAFACSGRSPAPSNPAAVASEAVHQIAAPRTPLPAESASAGITRFAFIAYGDSRGRHDGESLQHEHGLVVKSILETIASMAAAHDSVRFVVWSGDAVVDGRVPAQWNVSFIPLVDRITTEGGIPFFPSPGNHDVAHASVRTAPERTIAVRNYYSAFRALIPAEGSSRRLDGYPTYAFGYGNSFFIGWDSNIAGDAKQLDWIRAQLEGLDRARYPNVFVFEHHPAFSSGSHGGGHVDEQTIVIRGQYMPLFRKHHVRLMLAGHEHLFEHWVERYNDASGRAYRLDQIVSGGGGAPIYTYSSEPDLLDYLRAGEAEKVTVEHLVKPGRTAAQNPYHYLVVHVDGTDVRIDVIGAEHAFHPYGSPSIDLGPTMIVR